MHAGDLEGDTSGELFRADIGEVVITGLNEAATLLVIETLATRIAGCGASSGSDAVVGPAARARCELVDTFSVVLPRRGDLVRRRVVR